MKISKANKQNWVTPNKGKKEKVYHSICRENIPHAKDSFKEGSCKIQKCKCLNIFNNKNKKDLIMNKYIVGLRVCVVGYVTNRIPFKL